MKAQPIGCLPRERQARCPRKRNSGIPRERLKRQALWRLPSDHVPPQYNRLALKLQSGAANRDNVCSAQGF